MPVDCLVGLQWGSEGKGKWVSVIASEYEAHVRVGAPNAGHTIYYKGVPYKMRQIPCGWVNHRSSLYIGPAGLVDVELLEKELAMLPEEAKVRGRLLIDNNAGLLEHVDKHHEESQKFNDFNGSTSEGCGHALARKVLRKEGRVASMDPRIKSMCDDVKLDLWDLHEAGLHVLIEGTQGYGLSINHGPYPFVTSRDVLASSLLSDTGFSPRACSRVFGVLRTYPIRVAGNSGPMGAPEISWPEVEQRAGFPAGHINERTTVTNRVRRVSEMNWDLLREACRANEPDGLLVSFIEYLDSDLAGCRAESELRDNEIAMEFIAKVESVTECKVIAVSTGPLAEDTVYFKRWWESFTKPTTEVA